MYVITCQQSTFYHISPFSVSILSIYYIIGCFCICLSLSLYIHMPKIILLHYYHYDYVIVCEKINKVEPLSIRTPLETGQRCLFQVLHLHVYYNLEIRTLIAQWCPD